MAKRSPQQAVGHQGYLKMTSISESDLKIRLIEAIKPDLNMIYTEKPFDAFGGVDYGWFCREHSLHVYILARLLGFNSEIIGGYIQIRYDNVCKATPRSDSSHFWCSVGNIVPVDVSLSLKYFKDLPDVDIIYGKDITTIKPYDINYIESADSTICNNTIIVENALINYYPQSTISIMPKQLITNPYMFLLLPSEGRPKYTDTHGDDIFNMITMHCYKLATDQAKPLSVYCDYNEALRKIKQWNANAGKELIKRLNLNTVE